MIYWMENNKFNECKLQLHCRHMTQNWNRIFNDFGCEYPLRSPTTETSIFYRSPMGKAVKRTPKMYNIQMEWHRKYWSAKDAIGYYKIVFPFFYVVSFVDICV